MVHQTNQADQGSPGKAATNNVKATGSSLSFSSSERRTKTPLGKRKVAVNSEEGKDGKSVKDVPAKKKSKKSSKALLSFGDDA